jgi:hypothetical protein
MAKKKRSGVKTLRQVQRATLADVRRAMAKPPVAAEAERNRMKSANWEPCSETSINCELNHLREVRTSLSKCIDVLPEDDARTKMAMALSFVQMAMDALTSFQAEQVADVIPTLR